MLFHKKQSGQSAWLPAYPDEVTLCRDLKEVWEEDMQITKGRTFQTAGTVSIRPPSSSVLVGTSEKDAGLKGGKAVGFY